ncbi:unnamed protein product [Caenorhabditis angaria]|uniref:Sdz-33 F-box domain-containing protein n=1 Tax=Caenorhabditis angaria TaxID=860376 RepID=A0A9P1I7K2_9PELO|nr:unnamed protein product [Caenorhabditis angaria]
MNSDLPEITQNENEYPYSISWFDIPEVAREVVINKMDPMTVFRFKQCSKLCATEGKRSKNAMHKIQLNYTEKGTHICFHLTNEYPRCPHFRYTFVESKTKNKKWANTTVCQEKIEYEEWEQRDHEDFMNEFDEDDDDYGGEHQYINKLSEEQWRVMENGEIDGVVVKYLEKFLEEYKYSLKSFVHDAIGTKIGNLDMKHLKNLEDTMEFEGFDVMKNNLLTINQIAKCTEKVWLRRTDLTFDELIQLKAKDIFVGAKDLTNEQVKRYLKMWENGEIDENIRNLHIEPKEFETLDEEYYTNGLLTVFESEEDEEPAYKRQRSSFIAFKFMALGQ